MAKAEKPKPSKKTQYGRFVETARKLDCDESEEAFDQAFSKIVPSKTYGPREKRSAVVVRRKS
jgi:hypothetical protein